ncbi:glycosyltransferase family 2 protein [Lapidilactobacillus dextrinicus]|uniref:glycosyltransferase family 2 protein n=1 Tax=Lapidilactobacillus dextrinicus TaxID=51664 RepID=UPI0022E7AA84|nr:glycosyltransferase family 2 protein [Lapidilactobacillus dextrinicus]
MDFGAVIVTYNRSKLLIESIDSLLKQTVPLKKIIVIDNASTDDTESIFYERFSDQINHEIEYIKLPKNIGGAGGFNKGIRRSQDFNLDYISVSDDDAIYEKDYFEIIQNEIMKHPDVSAFCGTVKYPDGDIQLGHKRRILGSKSLLEDVNVSAKEYQKIFEADIVSFVGLVISTHLISQIGLPLTEYFIWSDDFEYCLRIREHSKILCIPQAIIIHKTTRRINVAYTYTWKEYYGIRNQINCVMRHTKHPIYSYLVWVRVFGKVLISNYLNPKYSGYRMKRGMALIKGCRDGLKGKLGKNSQYLP